MAAHDPSAHLAGSAVRAFVLPRQDRQGKRFQKTGVQKCVELRLRMSTAFGQNRALFL